MDCFISWGSQFCPWDVNKDTHTSACAHTATCTHTNTAVTRAATGNRMKMKAERGRREEGKKIEGGEKPMWQREILIFTEISWSLPLSLSRILPRSTATAFSLKSFFPFPFHQPHPTVSSASLFSYLASLFIYLFFAPSFTFLPMPSTPLSSFSSLCCSVFSLISPSAFTRSYYHALCIPPPSSSLCHCGRAAGRQRQHTLMLLYLTRHTHTRTHVHSPATCTAAHTYRKEKRGRWEYRDTHTHTV